MALRDTPLDYCTDTFEPFEDDLDWTHAERLLRCPRVSRERVIVRTGELVPDYCKANGCLFCSQVKARLLARAMVYASPTHLLTLTRAGSTWPEVRDHMKALQRALNRRGRIALAWAVERDSSSLHVHALAHGHVPRAEVLTERAGRAGMGHANVTVIENPRQSADYALKGVRLNVAVHLDLNGGRLLHASRDYWRTPDGEQVPGQEAAIKESR